MGTNTNNHGFGKPTLDGDTDVWGEILNQETIDKLEERVTIVDTNANRTNYTAYADALFIASDTGQVYTGDGASWNELDIDVATHSATHENGGADEIDVTGLTIDTETTDNHSVRHEDSGDDEIDVTGLAIGTDTTDSHASRHESGGSDQLTDLDLDTLANQDYNEAVATQTATTGTITIDLSAANLHEIEADGDITIAFSNVSSSPPGNSLTLYLYDDDATGPHTITWPASVEWSNGNAETEIPSDGDIEISLISPDGGTTWRARLSGEAFA